MRKVEFDFERKVKRAGKSGVRLRATVRIRKKLNQNGDVMLIEKWKGRGTVNYGNNFFERCGSV
jgi:hypothetical protein